MSGVRKQRSTVIASFVHLRSRAYPELFCRLPTITECNYQWFRPESYSRIKGNRSTNLPHSKREGSWGFPRTNSVVVLWSIHDGGGRWLWEEDFVDDTSAFNSDSLQLSCPGLAYPGAGSESCKFDVITSDFEAKKTMAGGYMGSGVKVRFMNGTMGHVWALISDWTTGSGLVPVRTCSNHFRNEERISTPEDFSYLLTRVCRTVPVRSSRVSKTRQRSRWICCTRVTRPAKHRVAHFNFNFLLSGPCVMWFMSHGLMARLTALPAHQMFSLRCSSAPYF